MASRQNSNLYRLPFWATYLALSLTACEQVAVNADNQRIHTASNMQNSNPTDFTGVIKDCPSEFVRIDTPQLGHGAPPVRIIYPKELCAGIKAGQAGIFIMSNNHWNMVYEGSYTRGNNRVDRGGKSYTYWLVSDTTSNAALRYRKDQLILTIENVDTLLLKDMNDR